jgi:hypothetical protein
MAHNGIPYRGSSMGSPITNSDINRRKQSATPRGVGVLAGFFAARAQLDCFTHTAYQYVCTGGV